MNTLSVAETESITTEMVSWNVYMVRCADSSLYTGVTTDVMRRLFEHNSKSDGARYTKSRQPVNLVYVEFAKNRSAACRREYQLKKLSKRKKEALISSPENQLKSI